MPVSTTLRRTASQESRETGSGVGLSQCREPSPAGVTVRTSDARSPISRPPPPSCGPRSVTGISWSATSGAQIIQALGLTDVGVPSLDRLLLAPDAAQYLRVETEDAPAVCALLRPWYRFGRLRGRRGGQAARASPRRSRSDPIPRRTVTMRGPSGGIVLSLDAP